MTPAHVVQITTPGKFILNGLWFGPKKAKTVFIFTHGLAGSMFGEAEKKLAKPLVGPNTAVLLFNNRGHDIISKFYGEAPHTRKGYKRIVAGAAHEIFTDCVDDLEGAVGFVEKAGAKRIALVGHSTGCQKSMYWASKKGTAHHKVKAIVLLAPVSDRSAYLKEMGARKLSEAASVAKSLIRRHKPHNLLSQHVWPDEADAQRVLSLISVDSEEEIFLYAQPNKTPKTLQKVRIPTLLLWAERDEYADRSASEIATWFEKNLKGKHKVLVVPKVGHNFKGAEKQVAREVARFIRAS